jgi:hypothetical protein
MNNNHKGQEIPPDQQNTGALLLHQRERKNILGCVGLLNTRFALNQGVQEGTNQGIYKAFWFCGIRYRRFLLEPQSRAAGTIYLNLLQKKRVGET